MNFEITNLTKSKPPISEVVFFALKKKILGAKYDLSLSFVGDTRAQKLNITYRNKSYIPNTLSFPLDSNSGEIFLNINQIKKETKKFNLSHADLIVFMFIHSCLHLKGFAHGEKMEAEEKRLFEKYLKK